MEITEVRIKLMENADDRLQAFCSVTFDHAFVVRDLKIIGGANGPFVAMPSRKLTSHCPQCGFKNHLRAHYCNQCGARQRDDRTVRDPDGRIKLYADIAHPINAACREQIQSRVLAEFRQELERSRLPGYVSRYDEDYDLDFELPPDSPGAAPATAAIVPTTASSHSTAAPSNPPSGLAAPSSSSEPNSLAAAGALGAPTGPNAAAVPPAGRSPAHGTPSAQEGGAVSPNVVAGGDAAATPVAAPSAAPIAPAQTAPAQPAPAQTAPAATTPIPPPHTPRSKRAFGAGVFDEERQGRTP